MSAQTSYTINQQAGNAGQLYALGKHDIVSRDVETAAGIGFGLAVSRGTDTERQIVLGGAAYLGIAVRSLDQEGAGNSTPHLYSQNQTASVLRKGYVWARCADGCNPGDSVNFINATGVLGAGAAGAGETDIAGATWESVAAAGELAVLRINS